MKNKVKLISTLAVSVFAVAAVASCGKSKEVGGEYKVQVKMYEGGYGRNWFDKIAENFQTYYKAKHNIDVTIELKQEDFGKKAGDDFINLIENPKDNQYDLFVLDRPDYSKAISDSYAVLKTKGQALLEPLDEVLNSKAITNAGKEEESTIKSRLYAGYAESLIYHRDSMQDEFDGKTYIAPWCDAVTGIFCNTSMLSSYGLEVPVTTDQFINAVNTIYAKKSETNVSPFTYSGQDAPGYWDYLFQTWLAQWMTPEGYKNYQLGRDPNATEAELADPTICIRQNGYKVYADPGIQKALEPMVDILYTKNLITGSHAAPYGTAQKNFADKNCVFMVNGDWLLKEMSDSIPETTENLKKVEIIKTPVLSSIGTAIGVDDNKLASIVKDIDNQATPSEIATKYSITKEQADYVKKARTVHHGEGGNHVMCIPSYSDSKEVAKEFIRFMYSEDSCRTFNDLTYANLPLAYTPDPSKERSAYEKSLMSFVNYDEVYMVCLESRLNEVRNLSGMLAFNKNEWVSPTTYKSIMINNSDSAKTKWTAEYIASKEAEHAKSQWTTWMEMVGW